MGVHALAVNPVYKSSVSVKGAAVAALAPAYPGSSGPSLLVSTFGVTLGGGNPTYVIKDLPSAVSGNASAAAVIESSEHWSNFIGTAPSELGHNLVVLAGGFLVPVGSISTGTVCIFDVTDPKGVIRTQISTDKKGWFYHKVTR